MDQKNNGKTVTRSDLVKEVTKNTNLSRDNATIIVNTIIETIIEESAKGNEVIINGFGAFRIRPLAPMNLHNVNTGGRMILPKRMRLAFLPYSEFIIQVNQW